MDAFARTYTRRRRVARATAGILALTALQLGITMYGPGRQRVESHGGPASAVILVEVPVPESDASSDTPSPALSPICRATPGHCHCLHDR